MGSNFHMARASGWNNLANETNVSNARARRAGLEIAGSRQAMKADRYGFLRDTRSSISESVSSFLRRSWKCVGGWRGEREEER